MTRTAVGITAFIVALLLLVAGGLAIAGSRYISGNVHDELAAQKIAFAPAGSPGLPADIQSYGGRAVTNGADAKVFANQYISAHIGESIAAAAKTDPRIKGMSTYSELSGLARTDPKNQSLSGLVDSVFRGEMLRSSLLSAWGWDTMASIMYAAAFFAFGAAVLLIIAGAALVPAVATRVGLSRLVPAEPVVPAPS